jgi:hypothetical protein
MRLPCLMPRQRQPRTRAIRNPHYAPEMLESRLNPSFIVVAPPRHDVALSVDFSPHINPPLGEAVDFLPQMDLLGEADEVPGDIPIPGEPEAPLDDPSLPPAADPELPLLPGLPD